MKIELWVKGKLYMPCYSEFVAMCNYSSLVAEHGKENVKVKRSESNFKEENYGTIKV